MNNFFYEGRTVVNKIVENQVAREIALAFTDKHGFKKNEIFDFFNIDYHCHSGSKADLFVGQLYNLSPSKQFSLLYELLTNPPLDLMLLKHPTKETRRTLLRKLFCSYSANPIGLGYSKINYDFYKEEWFKVSLKREPSESTTLARTMYESICKKIIFERGNEVDKNWDLGRLLKETIKAIDCRKTIGDAMTGILTGMTNAVNQIGHITNSNGHRHGNQEGQLLSNKIVSDFIVNSIGTISLLLIELHLATEVKGLDREKMFDELFKD